jgi:hypothetical protein
MAYTDPRDRRKPDVPGRDWEEDLDEDLYREPMEGQPPNRERDTDPLETDIPGDHPDRSREHSPSPNAR